MRNDRHWQPAGFTKNSNYFFPFDLFWHEDATNHFPNGFPRATNRKKRKKEKKEREKGIQGRSAITTSGIKKEKEKKRWTRGNLMLMYTLDCLVNTSNGKITHSGLLFFSSFLFFPFSDCNEKK